VKARHLTSPSCCVGLLSKLQGDKAVYAPHEDVPKQSRNEFLVSRWAPLALVAKLAEHVGASVFDAIVAVTMPTARLPSMH
jgi:hypothetical protein